MTASTGPSSADDSALAPPATNEHSGRSARDMVLSLAVLLLPVMALFILYETLFSGAAPVRVDPSDAWAAARHSGTFAVVQPQGLPPRWTVTSATFTTGTLRVGYVTPSGAGLQLVETAASADSFLPAELGADARPGNLVPIGARTWRVYPVVHDVDRALVLVDDGRTLVVEGSAPDNELRTFAAALA